MTIYRFMRIIVMFDLPTETKDDKKSYREFRKLLIRNGFLMMQNSVYCKLVINRTKVTSVIKKIKKESPKSGLIQILVITEKQFNSMYTVIG